VTTELTWSDASWRREAEAWIDRELSGRSIARIGATTQPHVRPWSTVLLVPTTDGDLYFKASGPVQAFEVPLLAKLVPHYGDRVPDVLAHDVERAWLLMRDGGTPFRELVREPRDLHHWEAVVPLYAEVQLGIAGEVDELLALGVPDLRLERLPGEFRDLVERSELADEERSALCGLEPRVVELCEELRDDGIPATLQHNDLHENNVLCRDGRYRLFDWGDSSISHPFQTMRVTISFARFATGIAADDPWVTRLRDAYLEPWSAGRSRGALLRSFEVAWLLEGVSDALTEDRVVRGSGLQPAPDDWRAVPNMLRRLAEDLYEV